MGIFPMKTHTRTVVSLLLPLALLVVGCSSTGTATTPQDPPRHAALARVVDPGVLNACYVQCNKDLDACMRYANSPEARTECSRAYNECRRNCE